MATVEDTIRTAEAVIASDSDVDERISQLTSYVDSFNLLFKEIEAQAIQADRAELEILAALHEQVIGVAVSLLGGTSVDLRDLQKKGKAILAYTDTLPKRVSMRGKKKG